MITICKQVYRSFETDILSVYIIVRATFWPPRCKYDGAKMDISTVFGITAGQFLGGRPEYPDWWKCPVCLARHQRSTGKWYGGRQ